MTRFRDAQPYCGLMAYRGLDSDRLDAKGFRLLFDPIAQLIVSDVSVQKPVRFTPLKSKTPPKTHLHVHGCEYHAQP